MVCRSEHAKRELVRVVRLHEATTDANASQIGPISGPRIQVDPSGKLAGRGAYLCRSAACWDNAALVQKLSAALKITLTAEDLAVLQAFRATTDA